jgi:sigma-54 specific flagellar transcriptional regulator A
VKNFVPPIADRNALESQSADPDLAVRRAARLIPGRSGPMNKLHQIVARLAPVDAPVLVQGPSGSGKELVAQALHQLSGRPGHLVALNCAAIPHDLLEAELFGAERGAYTGADRAREGLFEQARGGTLFLDEIGDLPLALQAKLLRVLESRSLRRLGGTANLSLDFRLIAATHCDLAQMVRDGRFREDLYFRLAVFPVQVPRLKDRLSDLPLLIDQLQAGLVQGRLDAELPVFDASALRALAAYDWPGNVRELRTLVQRAQVFFAGRKVGAREVTENLLNFSFPDAETAELPDLASPVDPEGDNPAAISEFFARSSGRIDLRSYLRDIEVVMITAALNANENCVSRAAEALGLGRTTLIEKIRKYGVSHAA